MKRLTAALMALALLMMPCMAGAAAELPEPAECFYVYDAAGVLDADTEAYIVERSARLYDQTGAQIVIAAVPTTGGEDLESYTLSLFNKWGVGDAEKNNGLLLVMAIGDDDYWCMPGVGLEQELTSQELSAMLYEYLEPGFAAKDYSTGAREFFDAAHEWMENYYGVSLAGSGPRELTPTACNALNMGAVLAAVCEFSRID